MSKHLLDSAASPTPSHERNQLREFLQKQNLRTDPRFFEKITSDDVIEVYLNHENKQIYCNQKFFSFCSYSREQLLRASFAELFWRSPEDHIAIVRKASEVALHGEECVPWDLPSHELVESRHPRKPAFEVTMGWIAPCFSTENGARRAWVSTLQMKFLFEWQEDL